MAKTADEFCRAIDDYLAERITYEECSGIMAADRFKFSATTPQGNPANPDNTALASHSWGGRSPY